MRVFQAAFILLAPILLTQTVFAQEEAEPRRAPNANVLTEEQWQQVDAAVERGLEWLATQQQDDGSFEAIDLAQPAVTSLCVMAFLAQGESPVDGKYQQQLTQAIDFIADQQKPNGLIARNAPSSVPISRDPVEIENAVTIASQSQPKPKRISITAVYNHAISALALCEAYGQCDSTQAERLAPVIEKAIAATVEMQRWKGKEKYDEGGWRYLTKSFPPFDSDLSVTGWQLMFLRSAKDAGFDVPSESIDAAVKYVENCFLKDEDRKVHTYRVGTRPAVTRAIAGTGILALAHAGKHGSKEALASGEWILKHDFSDYGMEKQVYGGRLTPNRYHYGAFMCTQAMYQLGGRYWEQFFPKLVGELVENQEDNGSWLNEGIDSAFGNCYTTSLCILSLSVHNQMLPILQR